MSITNCQHSLETVTANMGLAVIELKICSNCLATELEINQAEKLEKAEKALRFYADDENWCDTSSNLELKMYGIVSIDDIEIVNGISTGGKLARQTLKEIRGEG